MNTIYSIADDDSTRELLVYTLEMTGFHALGFSCGDAFRESLSHKSRDKTSGCRIETIRGAGYRMRSRS